MKTRLLIIIGISIVTAISLSYYAIYDSSTTVFISCDPRYEQIDDKCVLKISETDYEDPESQNQDKSALNNLKCSSNALGGIRCLP